ncbi:MAG TPA: sigma-54 dependent transcriptional regulator [Candidatus Brocadiia bacterium]|nr:sigma-54 dependent transcriptional regulator [Candidatus Brocadiia bacterium]
MTEKGNILIVEDDPDSAVAMAEALERDGHSCATTPSGREAIEKASGGEYEVVITDLRLPDIDGMQVLQQIRDASPETELIMVTAYGRHNTAVEAMQRGASAYISKPVNTDELRVIVNRSTDLIGTRRENQALRRQLNVRFGLENIIGNSAGMVRIFELIHQIAPTDATVLIQGESGTGKELIARAIHANSRRGSQRFVVLNCAALTESLLESELFGHEKGAFTGATVQRVGLFEHADHGTIFLDEIGDMPLSSQVKLLRVLETGEIVRVGSNEPIRVDVRVLAATHRNLSEFVEDKKFREDLFYRLNVVSLRLPPLRERREDISLLAASFMEMFASEHGKRITGISPDAMNALFSHDWPGNVRQLKNCVEHMVVVSRDDVLDTDDLPDYVVGRSAPVEGASPENAPMTLEDLEREHVRRVLQMVGGNREKAAQILGIGERTLYRKIERYDLR